MSKFCHFSAICWNCTNIKKVFKNRWQNVLTYAIIKPQRTVSFLKRPKREWVRCTNKVNPEKFLNAWWQRVIFLFFNPFIFKKSKFIQFSVTVFEKKLWESESDVQLNSPPKENMNFHNTKIQKLTDKRRIQKKLPWQKRIFWQSIARKAYRTKPNANFRESESNGILK